MTYKERLTSIRTEMRQRGIAAYIIPSSDPHISEYLPERFKCIAWTSGFTGSAGTLVITEDFAGLWTDARYFVQATEQLAGTGFELVKLQVQGKPEYVTWLAGKLNEDDCVAFDGNLASVGLAHSLEQELHPLGIPFAPSADGAALRWRIGCLRTDVADGFQESAGRTIHSGHQRRGKSGSGLRHAAVWR